MGQVGLDVPAADVARPPVTGVPVVTADDTRVYWWTGSRTVALDASDLTPVWTLPSTLGPAVDYANGLLVPVPAGLAGRRPATGRTERTLPVPAPTPTRRGPVPAVTGEMLLEQRGTDVVALRPSP